jgi:hypothetical protein
MFGAWLQHGSPRLRLKRPGSSRQFLTAHNTRADVFHTDSIVSAVAYTLGWFQRGEVWLMLSLYLDAHSPLRQGCR